MKTKTIAAFICTIVVLFLGVQLYTAMSYQPLHVDTHHEHKENQHIFYPEKEVTAGFIFYPGGHVDVEAYGDLMEELSKEGILCILLEMPANLAVLDEDAANGILAQYPEVKQWYIGGHSLGGVMASQFASEHPQDFKGVILLASYTTKDMSQTDLKICSILASNDQVLNKERYQEAKVNYPDSFEEHVIEGGCHAYFGNYGFQKNDGTPTITYKEQLEQTVQIISKFIQE